MVPEYKLEELFAFHKKHVSLDQPLHPDSDSSLYDLLYTDHQMADDRSMPGAMSEALAAAMRILEGREQEILRSYFGLDRPFPVALEDIAGRLELSVEHVRRLKDAALAKLRSSAYCEYLSAFLN